MISANTKRLLAFRVQLGKFHETDLSQREKKKKGGDPRRGFNQESEPEHVS